MTSLLIKLFVKDAENTKSEKVRMKYGILSGTVGIILNIILSVFKMIFGAITKSVSIIADGANNIFDAVSSIINLAGFKISGKPADKDHPFGHGRIEYLSALVLAFVILTMGVELIKSSFDKFTNPEKVIFSLPAVIVLILSIIAKIWLAAFNKTIGKKINSVSVDAVVADSIGDIAATTCSLIALVASKFTDLPVDAVMGIIVAGVIIFAGIGIIKDALGPLLGEPPDKEIVDELEKLVLSYDNIIGIHDLVLHSYGHGKVFGSLHAEVPSDCDMIHIHDTIDIIEKDIKEKLGTEISIHMDPVLVGDEMTDTFKKKISSILNDISPELTFHDFRIVTGPTHTNLIFDVVIPHNSDLTENEINTMIDSRINEEDNRYYTVITFDRSYI
ncbi:MAG: cation transporter [Clostridia bacterium]|nr:cation transporter [Clostridia bacterium]